MNKLQKLSEIVKLTQPSTILFPTEEQPLQFMFTEVSGTVYRFDGINDIADEILWNEADIKSDYRITPNVVITGHSDSETSDVEITDEMRAKLKELNINFIEVNHDEFTLLPEAHAIEISHNVLDLQNSETRTKMLALTIDNCLIQGGKVSIWDHADSILPLLKCLPTYKVLLLQADAEWHEDEMSDDCDCGCLHIVLQK